MRHIAVGLVLVRLRFIMPVVSLPRSGAVHLPRTVHSRVAAPPVPGASRWSTRPSRGLRLPLCVCLQSRSTCSCASCVCVCGLCLQSLHVRQLQIEGAEADQSILYRRHVRVSRHVQEARAAQPRGEQPRFVRRATQVDRARLSFS